MWIWIGAGAAVIVVVVIVILTLKARKKKGSANDDNPQGWDRWRKRVLEQNNKIDGELEKSSKKLQELNEKAAAVARDREADHDKIRDADNWDDLNDAARDIERRGRR